MKVYVIGTGRCGTSTFYHACKHINNYTVGHESSAGRLEPYDGPANHIEISSLLLPDLPKLVNVNGAVIVHLVRNRYDCVRSLAQQATRPIQRWCEVYRLICPGMEDMLEAATLYYDSVNETIRRVLLSHMDKMLFRLESWPEDWSKFWKMIGADGDFSAGGFEFTRKYNPAENRGRDNYVEK